MDYSKSQQINEILQEPHNLHHPMYNYSTLFDVQGASSNYPYWRMGGRNMSDRVKSALAPFNPFALQMVPTYKRDAITPFHKHLHFNPDPLPNPQYFHGLMPGHYDPLNAIEDEQIHGIGTQPLWGHGVPTTAMTPLPLACVRSRAKFNRCAMINGRNNCKEEGLNFLEVCPNWAINEYRKNKLSNETVKLVQMREYEKAMEVSEYNRGRTISDVDMSKTFSYGDRRHLRPDTMWADDRYADVTIEEIEAAKKRTREVELRKKFNEYKPKGGHGHAHSNKDEHGDASKHDSSDSKHETSKHH